MSFRQSDRGFRTLLTAAALVAGAVVVLMSLFLFRESGMFFSQAGFLRVFRDEVWSPMESRFGMMPILLGTLITTFGAVLWAVPCGFFVAVCINYLAPKGVRSATRMLMGILAGIPSVVIGFWGLVEIVPAINTIHAPGASVLAGVIVLGIMILPTMTLAADAAFQGVPESLMSGVQSLGMGFRGLMRLAILPCAGPLIVTGVVLAAGRAVGETMAVLMVTGNVVQIPDSIFAPVRTLAANIALEMAYAQGVHRASLFVGGLILLLLVIGLALISSLLQRGAHHANLAPR